MPLVHRLSGIGFRSDEERIAHARERPPTYPADQRLSEAPTAPGAATCKLCATRASTFDPSMRCCLDRYESLFGSVNEHRRMFERARISALDGDFLPARKLVKSYRRVFGPMAAVELKRRLWEAIGEAQLRSHPRAAGDDRSQSRSAA